MKGHIQAASINSWLEGTYLFEFQILTKEILVKSYLQGFSVRQALAGKNGKNVLGDLIKYFTQACVNEEIPETFAELARDFHDRALPDGYEALYALRGVFGPDTDKRDIIEFLIQEADKPRDDSGIEF